MINEQLKKFTIILGSASPRRKELLSDIGLEFSIQTTHKEEGYPANLKEHKIAEFLAKQKAKFLSESLSKTDLLITADTIVSFRGKLLNKPKNKQEAFSTLSTLSGNTHKVITGVCIKNHQKEISFSTITLVNFKQLTREEIYYYINNFNPFDKAGAYGIQDWIGKIGIKSIEGSYSNVVGLPTTEVYQQLKLFI
jgi:septum formation protein